ncbi:hypothetical protein TKK_0008559 [Trichogramma kaykai]|uniref:CCHC-type domain-containing protein n=1 Tax=Trichogramma kaykai TaxID=54128 RepID=A0ABD2X6U2_9HYME
MKDYKPPGVLNCYWSDLKKHPSCIHGPALLFGREIDGGVKKFYACSACRDRKICSFYQPLDEDPSKKPKHMSKNKIVEKPVTYYHQKLFVIYNQLIADKPSNRAYCHDCNQLYSPSTTRKHADHDVVENLTDYQMTHPTEILKPLENAKKEAQYLFSKKSVSDIMNMLTDLNAENVLCIGTPRIHEHITENCSDKMSSLLLDFDGRFHNFFGPLSYCWYNLFNHHFFQENSETVLEQFLTQNKGKNTFIVCDPPFGGRLEPMSQTMKTIRDLHKKLNNIVNEEDEIKVFFILPYYMEGIMKQKSNPQDVEGGLSDLKMSDYKVEYDNHPLFVAKDEEKKKQGSQVRIFTNVPQNLLKLPESDGYKYCKKCKRWVAAENKHCRTCQACTSKDGRTYRHCNPCKRCVKPSWVHCKKCNRCSLSNHKCTNKPKVGCCYKCNEFGHTEKECESVHEQKRLKEIKEKELEEKRQKRLLKRKARENGERPPKKQKKVEDNEENVREDEAEVESDENCDSIPKQDKVENGGKLVKKMNKVNSDKKSEFIPKQDKVENGGKLVKKLNKALSDEKSESIPKQDKVEKDGKLVKKLNKAESSKKSETIQEQKTLKKLKQKNAGKIKKSGKKGKLVKKQKN